MLPDDVYVNHMWSQSMTTLLTRFIGSWLLVTIAATLSLVELLNFSRPYVIAWFAATEVTPKALIGAVVLTGWLGWRYPAGGDD